MIWVPGVGIAWAADADVRWLVFSSFSSTGPRARNPGALSPSPLTLSFSPSRRLLTPHHQPDKQTFPDLDVVGWYATCPGPTLHPPFHGPLHNAVATLNEAAVGLLVDPSSAAPAAAPAGGALTAPLPIRLYERVAVASSGGGGDAAGAALPPPGGPSASFNLVPFSVEASEAERIGVAQAARTLPPGSTGGAAILAAHYRDLAGAVGGLAARVEALAAALAAQSTDPTTPPPRALARSAAALAARLPAAAGPAFCTAFATEQVDVLTTILLATVTRGTALTAELVAKLNAAYEPPVTPSMPGGGGGGGGGGRPMMASRMGGGGGGMMEGRWPQHEPLDRDFPGGGGGSGPRRGRRGAQ